MKAIIDFSGYTGPELLPVSRAIHDAMVLAAATFSAPPTPMPAFKTLTDDFEEKLTAKTSGAFADTIAFNIARDALEEALRGLGNYVNTVAKGDPGIVAASGFPTYETTRPVNYAPPAAPQNVVLRQGDVSGSALFRYRPERQPSMNEVQTCTSDPNIETNWKTAGLFSGGKANLNGFAPGTTVWVRVRTAGIKGVMGAWSDPAKIMVT